jgi:hypothetical protein
MSLHQRMKQEYKGTRNRGAAHHSINIGIKNGRVGGQSLKPLNQTVILSPKQGTKLAPLNKEHQRHSSMMQDYTNESSSNMSH